MNGSVDIATSAPAGSERFRLARLARDTALQVPGVVDTDPGPAGMMVTEGAGERLEGVLCVATKDGGYEITLRLICRLVPLPPLSHAVSSAVARAAAGAGMALDSVNVHVAAIDEGEAA